MQTPEPTQTKRRSASQRPQLEPLTYTLDAAAAASGLSKSTLWRRYQDGKLRMVKVGARRLVVAASLRALLGAEAGA